MQEKMHTLYVVCNKSYHYPLLDKLFGKNPLRNTFSDCVAVYCPEDPDECYVTTMDRITGEGGYLTPPYAGRTTILY